MKTLIPVFLFLTVLFSCATDRYGKKIDNREILPGKTFFLLNEGGRMGSFRYRDYESVIREVLILAGLTPADYFTADIFITLNTGIATRPAGYVFRAEYDGDTGTTRWIRPGPKNKYYRIGLTYLNAAIYREESGKKVIVKTAGFSYPSGDTTDENTLFIDCVNKVLIPNRRRLR